jgi:hypothetical protein
LVPLKAGISFARSYEERPEDIERHRIVPRHGIARRLMSVQQFVQPGFDQLGVAVLGR